MLGFFTTINSQTKVEPISTNGLNYLSELYYNQSNWKALIGLESLIIANDSIQSNAFSRLGQAFYYTNLLPKAEKYLKKAYQLNPDETTLFFYYYSIYFQGFTQEANQLKNKMSQKTIEQIENATPISTLESIAFEAGIKSLKEKEVGGNLNYASILTSWNLDNSFKLNIGINYLTQSLTVASYSQPEIYISLPIALGKGWTLTPVYHGVFNKYTLKSDADNTVETIKIGFFQAALNKRINQFNIGINLGNHFDNTTTKTTSFSKTIILNTLQLGFSSSYLFQFGPEFYYLLNPNYYILSQNRSGTKTSGNAVNINNSFYWKKWSLLTSYLSKDDFLFADNSASYYFNSPGKIKNRYSLSIGKVLSTHFESLITYQKEEQTTTEIVSINYNSLFLTLKYKL